MLCVPSRCGGHCGMNSGHSYRRGGVRTVIAMKMIFRKCNLLDMEPDSYGEQRIIVEGCPEAI